MSRDTSAPLGEVAGDPVHVGARKQLFVDDHVVERMDGLRRAVNQFRKYEGNPVLKADLPWEGLRIGEFDLLYDEEEGLFKCWYPGCFAFYDRDVVSGDHSLGYAVSHDGVDWEKRRLDSGITPAGGGLGRTILLKDTREEDPDKRYKALCRGPEGWYYTSYSPDGLGWSGPVERTTMRAVDDPPYLHYDGEQGVFTFYRRFWTKSHEVAGGGHQWGWPGDRAVGLAMSRDFVYWQPNNTLILRADETDQRWAREHGGERADIHAMRGFPYEGLWLGFVERENLILPAIMKDGRPLTNDDSARIHSLASSRDGYSWRRLEDRAPPIPLGKKGEWDCADLGYPTSRPFVRDDELWVFYRGGNCTKFCPSWYGNVEHRDALIRTNADENDYRRWKAGHDHPWDARTMCIGLAKIRLDGFVSVDACDGRGALTTKPLVFDGNHLIINADATGGSIAVEIQDTGGKAIKTYALSDCRTFTASAVHHRVAWNGGASLAALAGRPVRLKFVLANARLYAFRFAGRDGWL